MRAARWFQIKRLSSVRAADAGTAGTIAAFAGIGVLLVTAGWGWWTVPGIAAIAFGAAIVLAPHSVLVGDDGARFPGGAFVPWSALESLDTVSDGVILRLRSGEEIHLVTRGTELAVELGRRLAEWRDADEPEPPSMLGRGGRDAATWVAGLRSLGALGRDYRSPVVSPEVLWDLLRTPRASEDARVAAIVALGAAGDDARRLALREIAEASASARVRAVADAITAGADDKAVSRAVAG